MIPRERFGLPQVLALLLLAAYLAQALWVVAQRPLERAEVLFARAGLEHFHGRVVQVPAMPVPAALAAIPFLLSGRDPEALDPDLAKWTLRLPFVAFGWLLGASIWYVARRLYGNAGGYLALALFCFSSFAYFVMPGPVIAGALGTFGTVFVAIAAAHTLYAPPRAGGTLGFLLEVRHRWRRVLLLGTSIALALGSGDSSLLVLVIALALMLYLVPERASAAAGIFLAACVVAGLTLLAVHGFRPGLVAEAVWRAQILTAGPGSSGADMLRGYWTGILRSANLALPAMALAALATYCALRKARYFGNTAPLVMIVLLVVLGMFTSSDVFLGPFGMRSLPFVFVFIGGTFADLMEGRRRRAVGVATAVLFVAYAAESLTALTRLQASLLR